MAEHPILKCDACGLPLPSLLRKCETGPGLCGTVDVFGERDPNTMVQPDPPPPAPPPDPEPSVPVSALREVEAEVLAWERNLDSGCGYQVARARAAFMRLISEAEGTGT